MTVRAAFLPCLTLQLPLSARQTFHAQHDLTCSATPPICSRKSQKVSRRAFLALVAASLVSTQFTCRPQSAEAKPSTLLDRDFKPEGDREKTDWDEPGYGPKAFSNQDRFGESAEEAASYEDYLRVLKIPPIDYSQVWRSYARIALVASIPVAFFYSASAITFRLSKRETLPYNYDVYALQRYFSLRPDIVLRRMAQFAREATFLGIGFWCDSIHYSLNTMLVRLRLRSLEWRDSRSQQRAQERAVSLRDAITRLGPAMIKLGQAAASRPDLLSAAVVRELQPLQDDVLAVFPPEEAFAVIQDQLGAPVSSIFDDIDEHPVAGASLGMVFKAHVDGVAVAVKVQRPEVAASIALDCYIIRSMATVASVLFGMRTDLRAAVDEYASRLFEELDYTNELDNMTRFRELYANVDGVYLPRAFPQYCSRRVLVTEWVDGEKLIDEQARVRPEDLGLVETGIRFALMQLLEKGFLHAGKLSIFTTIL